MRRRYDRQVMGPFDCVVVRKAHDDFAQDDKRDL